MFRTILYTITLLFCFTSLTWANEPLSFYQAKRQLIKIYQDHPVTFLLWLRLHGYQKSWHPNGTAAGSHHVNRLSAAHGSSGSM